MKTGIHYLIFLTLSIVLAGCSLSEPQPASSFPTYTPIPTMPAACPDPAAIVKTLYTSIDAGQYNASLAYFTNDATLSTWAEGINGHHMNQKDYAGLEKIRTALSNPGLRRFSGQPDSPIFHEDKIKATGNKVTFMLVPDRAHQDGRPYNPYTVTVVFDGCKIQAMTVIEQVSWL